MPLPVLPVLAISSVQRKLPLQVIPASPPVDTQLVGLASGNAMILKILSPLSRVSYLVSGEAELVCSRLRVKASFLALTRSRERGKEQANSELTPLCPWHRNKSHLRVHVSSDHVAQIVELLGKIPPDVAFTGRYSAEYFDRRGEWNPDQQSPRNPSISHLTCMQVTCGALARSDNGAYMTSSWRNITSCWRRPPPSRTSCSGCWITVRRGGLQRLRAYATRG